MPRPPAVRLPAIAVEAETNKRYITLPVELDAELVLYAGYFKAQTGKAPRSPDDVITGLLSAFLDNDHGFQQWKKSQDAAGTAAVAGARGPKKGKAASPDARPTPQSSGAAANGSGDGGELSPPH